MVLFRLRVGPGEDVEVARFRAVPVALHRRHLDRLMLKRVQPMQVADQELQRRQDGGQSDRPCAA